MEDPADEVRAHLKGDTDSYLRDHFEFEYGDCHLHTFRKGGMHPVVVGDIYSSTQAKYKNPS